MEEETQEKFRGIYVEYLLDNTLNETQEEKIKYNVNGFINSMAIDNPNDDVMRMFFETMNQLSVLDIRILSLYDFGNTEYLIDIMNELGLDINQTRMIKEKLNRLGLIESRNDEIREYDIKEMVRYITEYDKDIKSKKPKGVKAPKFKKISKSESYTISSLGRSYLMLMKEPV